MKSHQPIISKSSKSLLKQTPKTMIIKGSQNISYDANMMAQIQQQKSYQEQLSKKNRMQSFLNSTRMNATKLYKQKCQKNNQKINNKKIYLQKQKDLKSKYTMVKKSQQIKNSQSLKNINRQPTKVQWKKTQTNTSKIQIPEQKLYYQANSDSQNSVIDSDIQKQIQANPNDLLKYRQNIRNSMLNKFKSNSK